MAGGEWLLALVLGQESASTRENMHSFCHAKASDPLGVDQANRRERMFWEFLQLLRAPPSLTRIEELIIVLAKSKFSQMTKLPTCPNRGGEG